MTEYFVYKRVCNQCKIEKGLCDFVVRRGRPTSTCYECSNKATKARYNRSLLKTGKGSPWHNGLKVHVKIEINRRNNNLEF